MINEVTLIGRVGTEPERKDIPTGSVTNVNVATKREWKDRNNERHSETEWHNVVLYGKLGSYVMDKLTVGSLVYVKGRIKTTKWKDTNDVTHKYVDIIAEEFRVLEKPKISDSLPTVSKCVMYEFDEEQHDVPVN